jgi:serine/threonine-protein kinase HipA
MSPKAGGFFELAVFCFLIGNSDLHLKNFSLLETPPENIRLAPVCDLLPNALLFSEDTEETALTLQGKKRLLTEQDFRRF